MLYRGASALKVSFDRYESAELLRPIEWILQLYRAAQSYEVTTHQYQWSRGG